MNDKKTLEQSILDDLYKTGYPTEVVSASILQRRDWHVVHNPSYWDEEEGQSREFDISAYRNWKTNNEQLTIGIYLIVECKKSEKPWVFFTTPEKHDYSRLGAILKWRLAKSQIFTDYEHADSLISDDYLRQQHHYFRCARLARTFHEPWKNQERAEHSQMIYSAVMSTVKATRFHQKGPPIAGLLQMYYPLVIFDGNLFEASVEPDKTIDLQATSHVQLSFSYIPADRQRQDSAWGNVRRFIVDIVRESYLADYVTIIENEHEALAANL
jgi:hypothetical protein